MAHRIRFDGVVDVARSASVLRRGHGDPTYRVVEGRHWRASRLGSGVVSYRLRQTGPDEIEVDAWGAGADELIDQLVSWFPIDDFATAQAHHDVVADAQRRFPGLRTMRTGRVVEALIPAIIEQKVVGRDAFASWRRLVATYGDPAPGPAPPGLHVPPTSETWAALASWEWHRAGVDPQRYRTAQAAAKVGERLDALLSSDGPDAVIRAMRAIPGVGPWTAAEVAVRALGDPDAVSWGDFHLATTVGTGLLGRRVTDDEVPALLEPYRPFRGRVVRLLELSPLVQVERRGPRMSRVDHRSI